MARMTITIPPEVRKCYFPDTGCLHLWGHEDHDAEVGCSDCGSHPALRCVVCGDFVDLIHEDPRDICEAAR